MKFGFLTEPVHLDVSGIIISPVAKHSELLDCFYKRARVSRGWILPPITKTSVSAKERKIFRELAPYQESRMFSLPSTHSIEIVDHSEEKARFLVLAYGFVYGLLLAPEGPAYLDRVAYEPGKLTGLTPNGNDANKCMEAIYENYSSLESEQRKGMYAVLYWFLAGQSYRHLWDKFDAMYKVLDGIFRLSPVTGCPHAQRPRRMAEYYGIDVPDWASTTNGTNRLSELRNELVHEARFNGEPIGFSNPDENFDLELRAFNLKLICKLLGINTPYIQAGVSDPWERNWDIA